MAAALARQAMSRHFKQEPASGLNDPRWHLYRESRIAYRIGVTVIRYPDDALDELQA
jgi:hypothetical protein